MVTTYNLLSTDQAMITARNTIYLHVQNFILQDELLLPILKAVARYTLIEILGVVSLSAVVE
jgi:hypothetical protein